MLYLLDANVLIDANRDYYPLDRVPEFWEWLEFQGVSDNIKVPLEVYEEVTAGNDALAEHFKEPDTKDSLLLEEEVDITLVQMVTEVGYASNLTEDEIEKIGRDPFLIAYGLADNVNRWIVTTEGSRPNKKRANRHIPDICSSLGIESCNTFKLLRELDFKTKWR